MGTKASQLTPGLAASVLRLILFNGNALLQQSPEKGNAAKHFYQHNEPYFDLSVPFGLAPTKATIGGYRRDHSVRALH